MKRRVVCGIVTAALFGLGAGQAPAAPADSGNCWGNFVNGADNGSAVSADAGPRYGLTFAPLVKGGAVGQLISGPDCRP